MPEIGSPIALSTTTGSLSNRLRVCERNEYARVKIRGSVCLINHSVWGAERDSNEPGSHHVQYELSKAHFREVRLVVIIDLASDSRLPTSAEARKSLALSNIEPEHEGIS